MYQFKAPHRPWEPANEFKDLFTDGDLPHPKNFNDDYNGRNLYLAYLLEYLSQLSQAK